MSQTIDEIKPGYPLFKQAEYQDLIARKRAYQKRHTAMKKSKKFFSGQPLKNIKT